MALIKGHGERQDGVVAGPVSLGDLGRAPDLFPHLRSGGRGGPPF